MKTEILIPDSMSHLAWTSAAIPCPTLCRSSTAFLISVIRIIAKKKSAVNTLNVMFAGSRY